MNSDATPPPTARRPTWVLWGFVMAIAVVVAVVLIVRGRRDAGGGTPTPGVPSVLRVGVILPQTGTASYIGETVRNGLELAREQFDAGPVAPFRLELRYVDTGSNVARVVSAYRSLVDIDKCQTIIAVQQGVKSIIPLVEADRRVLWTTVVPDNGVAGVNPWTFRFFINAEADSVLIADYAYNKLGLRRVAVMYLDDSMGQSYLESFRKRFPALGGEIVMAESYTLGDTDVRNQVLKVRESKPDAVYFVGYGENMARIPVQLREAGMTCRLLATGTIAEPDILKAAGAAAEGVYYVTTQFNTFAPQTDQLKAFVAGYQAKYKTVPVFFEVFGYDSLSILLHAARQAGTEPDRLRAQLQTTKDLPAAAGTVTIGTDNEVAFPICMFMIKNGTYAPAEP